MDTALVVAEQAPLPAELIAPLELAADFAKASRAARDIHRLVSGARARAYPTDA
jgi:hypothetical protein